MSEVCGNCGEPLAGRYCAACGQKRLDEADRRFAALLRQFALAATDLDGRFWGTLRTLLFRPGRLSRDYIDGRRARWMPPIGLFLFVNVVYFLTPISSDFASPFAWEVPGRIVLAASEPGAYAGEDRQRLLDDPGPPYGRLTALLVDRRVAARNAEAQAASDGQRDYDYRDYRRAYDAKVPDVSKALAIVHVPFLAAVLMLLFWRGRYYYAEHFVVALHLLAFDMAAIQILVQAASLIEMALPPAAWHSVALNWVVRAVLVVYISVALRRVYRVAWYKVLAATAALLAAYVCINFFLYRPVLFLSVFALT